MNKEEIKEVFRDLYRGYDTSGYGIKTVTSAGTPERITDQLVKVAQVLLQAEYDNTGYIFIGFDEEVSSTHYGAVLSKESIVVIPINDLSKIWIDSSVDGDGVAYIALV